jgi:hypothetical protein
MTMIQMKTVIMWRPLDALKTQSDTEHSRFMVFNATFNNISAISWLSVLLVEETGVPGENHRPATSHEQSLSHNVVSSTSPHETEWDLNSQL